MNNLNYVLLEGHLTRDPSLQMITSQCPLCSFTIGNNRKHRKSTGESTTDTSYFLVETWGSLATLTSTYLKKGQGVRVVGRLKQYSMKVTTEEKPRDRVYIVAEHIEFMPRHEESATAQKPEESKEVQASEDNQDSVIDQSAEELQTPKEVEDTLDRDAAMQSV